MAAPVVSADDGPPIQFELCLDCGILPHHAALGMGSGVAAADYDNDGDVDLFVPTGAGHPDRLYLNLGDGQFADVAPGVGLAWTGQSRTALWFDSDDDRRLDLIVANDDPAAATTYRLYRQTETGTFIDATDEAGFQYPLPDPVDPVERFRGGMAAGDLDNDGDLDLVTTMWNGFPEFWRNDDGVFSNVTPQTTVTTAVPFSHQPVIFDANGDGWQDVYIAVDFRWNVLAINQHDWTFADVAPQTRSDNGWTTWASPSATRIAMATSIST